MMPQHSTVAWPLTPNTLSACARSIRSDTGPIQCRPASLHEASGSAGKLAVFAVRVDTFDKPKAEQVFYVGTNDPEQLNEIRRRLLSECAELPEMGEYMHQSWFDGADRYCKDTFLLIKYLGTDFLPRLYRIKAALDRWLEKIPGLPDRPADHLLQRLAQWWPDHLPKRMREYRQRLTSTI